MKIYALLLMAPVLAVGLVGCLDSSTVTPKNGVMTPMAATPRPFTDFLSAQGTTSFFFPPVPDYIGWGNNNPPTHFALIDYLGLASTTLVANGGPSIATDVSGTVSERSLSDGRAEVTVVVHTTKALSWVVGLPGDIFIDPLEYGYRASELLADPSLPPSLSSCDFKVVFKNVAPGAAMPDIVNAFVLGNAAPGQELVSLMFRSSGKGTLRAPFGVEGAPASLAVSQTGLFNASFMGATADAFPAEKVDIHPVGGSAIKP